MGMFEDQRDDAGKAAAPQHAAQPATNPFDFGAAAEGVPADLAERFEAARKAWADHNRKMMTETVAMIDKAIGEANVWAQRIQQALDLTQEIIGIVQNRADQDKRMGTANELSSAQTQVQQWAAQLQNLRNGVPFLGNLVNSLLGGIQIRQ